MQRRGFLTAVASVGAGLTAAGSVRGTGTEDEEPIDLGAGPYRTNEQLTRDLRALEASSERISLRELARSAGRGDPIQEVQIGEGETNVHLITQIHGDEPVGTEAALLELRRLAHGTTEAVHRTLDALTLTVIPRVNPDGAMYATDTDDDGNEERLSRRQNTQEWEPEVSRHEPYYHATPDDGPAGYDLNRDFNIRPDFEGVPDGEDDWWSKPEGEGNKGESSEVEWALDMPYENRTLSKSGLLLGPETRAVVDSFLRADPDYAITHHHQGLATLPESGSPPEPSVLSVMAAFGPAYAERAPYYDADAPLEEYANPFLAAETSERSLRLNTLVADALAETTGPWDAFDSVTRYGYTSLWGSYLDTLCPQTGAAGMLYEIAGQSDEVGSRGFGLKLEATRVGFEETWRALAADPDLSGVDAESYFEVPLKGEDLGETTEEETADDETSSANGGGSGFGLQPGPVGTR
jgi:hypothetical protein